VIIAEEQQIYCQSRADTGRKGTEDEKPEPAVGRADRNDAAMGAAQREAVYLSQSYAASALTFNGTRRFHVWANGCIRYAITLEAISARVWLSSESDCSANGRLVSCTA